MNLVLWPLKSPFTLRWPILWTPSPAEIIRRLEFHGLCGPQEEEKESESEEGRECNNEEEGRGSSVRLQSIDGSVLSNLAETEFKAALGRQLISISPRVKYNVPYLQTAAGRNADIRKYLSRVIYWSVQFSSKPRKIVEHHISSQGGEDVQTEGCDVVSSSRKSRRFLGDHVISMYFSWTCLVD